MSDLLKVITGLFTIILIPLWAPLAFIYFLVIILKHIGEDVLKGLDFLEKRK